MSPFSTILKRRNFGTSLSIIVNRTNVSQTSLFDIFVVGTIQHVFGHFLLNYIKMLFRKENLTVFKIGHLSLTLCGQQIILERIEDAGGSGNQSFVIVTDPFSQAYTPILYMKIILGQFISWCTVQSIPHIITKALCFMFAIKTNGQINKECFII